MRIVGGTFRGHALTAPGAAGGGAAHLRPTADRVRESIFNLLAHGGYAEPPAPEGMRVLDLFAGTGALGLEALSRGATFALFVDEHGPSRALIRRNIEALGVIGQTKLYRRDALRLGPWTGRPFDLVFLDPPYGAGLGPTALAGAVAGGWLAPGALAVAETAAAEGFTWPDGFTGEDSRRYGETAVHLGRWGTDEAGRARQRAEPTPG